MCINVETAAMCILNIILLPLLTWKSPEISQNRLEKWMRINTLPLESQVGFKVKRGELDSKKVITCPTSFLQ